MRLALLTVALAVGCCGCGAPGGEHYHARDRGQKPEVLRVSIPPGITPESSTNEVLRIASQAASNRRYKLSDYDCDAVIFQMQSSEQEPSNRWMVHFVTHQRAPDLDFFVFVDDASGRATLQHR